MNEWSDCPHGHGRWLYFTDQLISPSAGMQQLTAPNGLQVWLIRYFFFLPSGRLTDVAAAFPWDDNVVFNVM